jgi:hypothetical protein
LKNKFEKIALQNIQNKWELCMIISLNVKDIFCNKLQTKILQKLLDPWFCPLLWMLFNHMDDAIVQFFIKKFCQKYRV